MKTLVYLSTATQHFSDSDLDALLDTARVKNKELNISGMLLFVNDIFIQVLEGEDEKVDALFRKIGMDPRHKSVLKLYDEKIEERLFDDWSMAFKKSTPEELSTLGYFSLEDIKEITEGVANYDTIKILRSILNKNT